MRSSYLGKAFSASRPARKGGWAVWFIAPSLLMGAGSAAFLSLHGLPPSLRLWEASRIEISGNHVLLPSEVQRDSRLGLRPSWLFLDAGTARANLMRNPWVASARVSRSNWRTVHVAIEERAPEVVLPHRGALAELDPQGVVLPLGGTRVAADLPALTGLNLDSIEAGRRVSEPRVGAALEFLALCRTSHRELWRRISELRLDEPGLVKLVLQGCEAEVWLRPEALNERKLALLDAVLSDVERRAPRVRVVDLRFRDQAVLQMDGPPERAASASHS